MTKLDRPVTRQTDALYRAEPLVVELHPKRLEMRLKGSRRSISVPYDAIYELGLKLAARSNFPPASNKRKI